MMTGPRRESAELDGNFVVFLIGARINKPWRLDIWWPVVQAMPRMLRELAAHPEYGCLGGRMAGGTLIQYWRSVDHLHRYAHDHQLAHLPAWRSFNRASRRSGGAVGVWHETYQVAAGQYETVYVDMPTFGLGQVGRRVPASGRRETAAGRLGREQTSVADDLPSPTPPAEPGRP